MIWKKDFNKRSKNIETIINYIENAGNNLKEFYEDNLNVKSGQRKKFTNNKKSF
ncbi:hypothetical protein NPX79_00335 [Spiroplasma endosymbiont of Anurida maritima]|uniref:hypothetical protein n=1 Tax=Spiroplasma endosymbiont of Anurida maritima TaxID=2967972 RepID=UPI0036D42388